MMTGGIVLRAGPPGTGRPAQASDWPATGRGRLLRAAGVRGTMQARRSGRNQAVHSHVRTRPGRGRARPVLGVVATGVVVAALAGVATTTTARFLLASGTAAAVRPCPAGSSGSPA